MENRIKLLPEIVANQIAAGEVVESASSVVKEMMENSIDAGAKSVTVNFRNAGLELIQIVDDGCGMSPLDARMAFDRHATSKISSFDDVYRLRTFGFRGEALASIAAVAQVELRTRQADDEVGTVTIVNGGEFVSQSPTMCPVGSQFLVRNLFYTAPARRKFNGSRSTIVSDIKREFRRVALCNPQVRCELMSNDMPIMTLPAASLSERIVGVVGRHIKSNLLEVSVDTTIVKVKGYVGRPAAAKQKNNEQYLFVNGRYFRSPQLYRSILKAYEKLIPENCSPSYFLYLTVEPERVDVNVSPHKTEVKFADNDDVNQIVTAAVRSTLAKSGSVALMDFENTPAIEIPAMNSGKRAIYSEPKSATRSDYNPFSENYIDPELKGDSLKDVAWSEMDAISEFAIGATPSPRRWDMDRLVGETSAESGKAESQGADRGSHSRGVLSEEPSERFQMEELSMGAFSRETESLEELQMPQAEVDSRQDFEQIIISSSIKGEAIGESIQIEGIDPMEGEESELEFIPSSLGMQQELMCEPQTLDFGDVVVVGGLYAVAECRGRVMLVDLRRAKERIAYDSYINQCRAGAVPSQRLIFPETLTLSIDDYALLEEKLVDFAAMGFDIELCGGGDISLCGLPPAVSLEQADSLLYQLLREVEAAGDMSELMRERMAQVMAQSDARTLRCKASVEAVALLKELSKVENYSYSPSGKPILTEIGVEELKHRLC